MGSFNELAFIMEKSGAFSNNDIQRSIQELQSFSNGTDRVNVGIKRVLKGIETARQDPDDMPARFASVMSKSMIDTGV